jgi:hypothetical protein
MTVRTLTIIYAAITAIIATIALMLAISPVRAEYAPSFRSWERSLFYWGSPCHECERLKRIRRQAAERAWRRQQWEDSHWRERHTRKIYSRHDDDDDDDHRRRHRKCENKLSVVGDQYASEQGAQQEADKAWMQTARWAYGERFMSRDHAKDSEYECGRSSVGSVVGQVFYRCRLTARPCSAPKTRAN